MWSIIKYLGISLKYLFTKQFAINNFAFKTHNYHVTVER